MLKRFTYLLLFILTGQLSIAQNTYNYGDFSIRNFGTNEYPGVAQNWDILQNNDDFIIIANNSGILHFDGTAWIKIKPDNDEGVRSLAKGEDGTIFVGGDNEFGKLFYDQKGEISYRKLSKDSNNTETGKIWYTIPTADKINFVSKKIFIAMDLTAALALFLFQMGRKVQKALNTATI